MLHEEHFANIGGFIPEQDMGIGNNNYMFFEQGKYGEHQLDWYKQRGCKSVKVEANEGDFIRTFWPVETADQANHSAVWDSRTIHWNASPVGDVTRFSTYVTMCPRSMMSDADLQKKLQLFKDRKGTTHWPVCIPIYKGEDLLC